MVQVSRPDHDVAGPDQCDADPAEPGAGRRGAVCRPRDDAGRQPVDRAAELTVSASVTPDAPVLGQPVLVSGNFVFNLPTQAGFTYQVQSKLNLEDSDWVPEQTVPGDGTTKAVTIGAGGPRKFLRVVVLP